MSYKADWVRDYLGVCAPEGLLIHPVIVVPARHAAPTAGRDEVKVMKRLDDGCRTPEF